MTLKATFGAAGSRTLYTDEADVLLTGELDKDRDFVTFGFGDVTSDGIGSRYGDGGNGVAYIIPGMAQ